MKKGRRDLRSTHMTVYGERQVMTMLLLLCNYFVTAGFVFLSTRRHQCDKFTWNMVGNNVFINMLWFA